MPRMVWIVLAVVFMAGILWPVPENDKSVMGVVVVPIMIIGSLLCAAISGIEYLMGRRSRQ